MAGIRWGEGYFPRYHPDLSVCGDRTRPGTVVIGHRRNRRSGDGCESHRGLNLRRAESEEAIERIASGGTMLDPDVVARLLGHRHDPLGSLTPKEREVVTCTAESCTTWRDRHRDGPESGSGGEREGGTSIVQELSWGDSASARRPGVTRRLRESPSGSLDGVLRFDWSN